MAFNIGFYAYAIIGHTRADQLLPQLLMEQFDTLPIQCRHIEHMHEGVWSEKIIFDKMTAVRTYLSDFFCSGIQFNLLLSPYPCFISLLYLDLYVLGDDALIS